jgi:polysaccharide export outer membrane protein
MGFLARLLSLVLAAALATACSGPITNVAPGNPATRAIGPSGGAATGNEIAAGDRLRITVFGDDRMSGEYNVDESGAITIPLGGPVSVAGRTAENAAAAIASVLVTAGLFRDPKVTVEIVTLRPFYILGEVNRPGEYPYRPGMSLFAAVATAGGYTYRADSGTVFIRKATEKAEREYGISADIAIMPGDVIRIPERYF